MWCAEDKTQVSITILSKSELFDCLKYLSSRELVYLRTTCVWFREAFFALVSTAKNFIINLANANKNYRFLSVTEMNVGTYDVRELFGIDFGHQFPQLTKLFLMGLRMDIVKLPVIDSLTELILFQNWGYIQENDIFDEVTIPGLRVLNVMETIFPRKIFNAATGLKKLILWDPLPHLTLTPKASLIHLEITGTEFIERLLPALTGLFPILKYLSIDCGSYWDEPGKPVALKDIRPHPTLETLRSVTTVDEDFSGASLSMEHFSHSRFPCLSKIMTNSPCVYLSTLTPVPNLKTLVVAKYAKVHCSPTSRINFPNLEIMRNWSD